MARVSATASLNASEWTQKQAKEFIRIPSATDDKYSHGVLGVVTGSSRYPGAAVLGVEVAHRTGVGMVRYLGAAEAADLVLARRPETVTVSGRVNAWLVGSGMDSTERSHTETVLLLTALTSGLPVVADAGALDLIGRAAGPLVITPHARELAALLVGRAEYQTRSATELSQEIVAEPGPWAERAADLLGVTVVLKGHVTHICAPQVGSSKRFHVSIAAGTTWLATAGTGDVLAGIIGALCATQAGQPDPISLVTLAEISATGVLIHAQAAEIASAGAPLVALDVAEAVPEVIRRWLA